MVVEGGNRVESRVDKLETRVDEHGRRIDRIDASHQRIWERLDQQSAGQVRTQTLIEVGNRDVADLKASFMAFRQEDQRRRDGDLERESDEDQADKARQPAWWQVLLVGGTFLVALASLLVSLARGGVVKP